MLLKEKLVALATNSAASQILANKFLKLPYFECSVHQLQMTIKDLYRACLEKKVS